MFYYFEYFKKSSTAKIFAKSLELHMKSMIRLIGRLTLYRNENFTQDVFYNEVNFKYYYNNFFKINEELIKGILESIEEIREDALEHYQIFQKAKIGTQRGNLIVNFFKFLKFKIFLDKFVLLYSKNLLFN